MPGGYITQDGVPAIQNNLMALQMQQMQQMNAMT